MGLSLKDGARPEGVWDVAAWLSLGTNLAAEDGWALSAGYAGRFGEGARDHGFLLGGCLRF